jgi:3-methyl-2-oxobutanoate hydroxymethyltransferase
MARFTLTELAALRGRGEKLVMLTCYDASFAALCDEAGVELLLVGDSLGMVVLGHESTLPVTMDEMLHHARAVGRRRKDALLVADLPWLSYHLGARDAIVNAARFVREARVDAVKLEGGSKRIEVVRALVDAEIPVMGHLGLTPQSVLAMGGYKVQGRGSEQADTLAADARALVEAGVFSLVLEGVPQALAARITSEVPVPTIGIGAGPSCDGQVLVVHDLLGMLPGPVPKFVRRYADLQGTASEAIRRWATDVRAGSFPGAEETYS